VLATFAHKQVKAMDNRKQKMYALLAAQRSSGLSKKAFCSNTN